MQCPATHQQLASRVPMKAMGWAQNEGVAAESGGRPHSADGLEVACDVTATHEDEPSSGVDMLQVPG